MTLDTTTSLNSNNFIVLALGTATLSSASFEFDYLTASSPIAQIKYENLENRSWEKDGDDSAIGIEQIQILQKLNTLKSFSNSITENSQSLDDETIEIINKNFWDWI